MNLNVTIRLELPPGWPFATRADLQHLKDTLMSRLSDKIAEVTASTDAAIGRVQSDVATLNQKIADLQALVDSGGATQADMDNLDALKAKVEALDPTTDVTLPTT